MSCYSDNDQGNAAEITYHDLPKGLGLKSEDLATYSLPLVSFEGKMVVPKGQIRLPVQAGADVEIGRAHV